ncbi:hypothetical protein midi_01232 [Candidatus Midichloria mitochondrii IricVA]|uniref:Uncharacterized protein n=1 Tax=Midichloria mitochondrii (strain IricVA) TaxID=696127 RepID=F7XUE4_MIDMI|nr:hypothetical protein midi_01232 [Candidatus Midichloria mitochondrii IricVA]
MPVSNLLTAVIGLDKVETIVSSNFNVLPFLDRNFFTNDTIPRPTLFAFPKPFSILRSAVLTKIC